MDSIYMTKETVGNESNNKRTEYPKIQMTAQRRIREATIRFLPI